MDNWEQKLNKFLETWEYIDDTIGVLVCGSYITGNPTEHSDLDVHIILDEKANYRERGNKYIDGLLVEYFANTPKQIRKYFKEDYQKIRPMSQNQFITGKILLDKTGEIQKLKDEALEMLNNNYKEVNIKICELDKYVLWDAMDDLEDILKQNREDFDFIYFINLDKLIQTYMKLQKIPYNKKTILGHIESDIVRKKYLLNEIPDKNIRTIIFNCITISSKEKRLEEYQKLTNIIFNLTGGFDIDKFKYKSPKDLS